MLRWLPPLLLAACSASAEPTATAQGGAELQPQTDPSPTALRIAIVGPELAPNALEAIDLWSRATDGEFSPVVMVSDTCTGSDWCIYMVEEIRDEDCFDPTTNNVRRVTGPRACSWSDHGLFQIELSRSALAPEESVSTIAHEMGHGFWLTHKPGTGDLMDPDRPEAVRMAPCVSAADVAEAGFAGPGACVEE